MCKILVIDQEKRPLNPIHPAQARQLLRNKKAAIFRRFPFTLILKEFHPDSPVSELRLKLDSGAKHTGIALVRELVTNTANTFTKRMVMDILRRLCPPFPLTAKLGKAMAGVTRGEER